MHIVVGESKGRRVKIDLDVLLRTRLLIQATSGGGKSYTIRRIAEQLFGKLQTILIDPEGEFASLREKYGFVLVGQGGETPADPRSAALVAHKLLELHASAVCDLCEMKPAARHEWARRFLEALVDAPRKLWHATVIIVDEAATLCPEKGAGESEASEAMISLATRGRKRGYCAVWATQRLGNLRKDAAAQMLNVLIGPTFIDIDRKRAAETLGIRKDQMQQFFDQIKVLDPGNFFALGPAISKDRLLIKIGPVETHHPEIGSAGYSAEPPPPPETVKRFLPKLAELPQQAEERARTEAELKQEIRTLKAQLRNRPTAAVVAPADTRIVSSLRRALGEAMKVIASINTLGLEQAAGIAKEDLQRLLDQIGAKLGSLVEVSLKQRERQFLKLKTEAGQVLGKLKAFVEADEVQVQVNVIKQEPFTVAPQPKRLSSNGRRLPVGELRILKAAAQYEEGAGRDQLSILAGYKRSSRDAYIARLQARGYVEIRDGQVIATQSGITALGSDFETLPQGSALADYWLARLPTGEKKILEILLRAPGAGVERQQLSEETGYQRSSRDAYLARLAARRLVVPVGPGAVKAAELLFD